MRRGSLVGGGVGFCGIRIFRGIVWEGVFGGEVFLGGRSLG